MVIARPPAVPAVEIGTQAGSASPSRSVDRESSFGLAMDAWRGVAALLVVFMHAWTLSLGNFIPPKANLAFYGIYLFSQLGHPAVILFFVLSGFFVGGSVIRAFAKGTWDWSKYLLARGVRLGIVLVPALLIGGCLDIVGTHFFPLAPQYNASAAYAGMLDPPVLERLTVGAFAANVFFLQELAPIGLHRVIAPTFGSNGPLWSLANEAWYYLLFPVALLALRGKSNWKWALLGLGVIWLIGLPIALRFVPWLFGAKLATMSVPSRFTSGSFRTIALAVVVVLLFLNGLHRIPNSMLSDYLLGLAFAAYLATLSGGAPAWLKSARVPITRLAGMSYTLYLVHLPALVLLTAAFGLVPAGQIGNVGIALILVPCVLVYAAAIWYIGERNTERLRAALSR